MRNVSQVLTMPKDDFDQLVQLAERHGLSPGEVITRGLMLLELADNASRKGIDLAMVTSDEEGQEVAPFDPWSWAEFPAPAVASAT